MSLHVGLSGFSYKEWQGEGRFYPADLKPTGFLGYYGTRFGAVEMDGTWYRMPGEDAVRQWIDGTPASFEFSFKMHRRVTHMARLKPESKDSVDFLLKRLKPVALAGKLGPFLVQLPPNLKRDDERLKTFLDLLPDQIDLSELGVEPQPLRWAFEFRNDTWHAAEVEAMLRQKGAAWVAADTDDADAQRRDTADFRYVRLRKTDYDEASLLEWASYLKTDGKPCYVYCKHEDLESPWEWADTLSRVW